VNSLKEGSVLFGHRAPAKQICKIVHHLSNASLLQYWRDVCQVVFMKLNTAGRK